MSTSLPPLPPQTATTAITATTATTAIPPQAQASTNPLIPPSLHVTVDFVGELGTLTMKFISAVNAPGIQPDQLSNGLVVYGEYADNNWQVGKITDDTKKIIYDNGETKDITIEQTRIIPTAVTICSITFDKSKVGDNLAKSSNELRNILDIKYSFFSDLYNFLNAIISVDPNIMITTDGTITTITNITQSDAVKQIIQTTALIVDKPKFTDGGDINTEITEYLQGLLKKIQTREPEGGYFDAGKKFETYEAPTRKAGFSDIADLTSPDVNKPGQQFKIVNIQEATDKNIDNIQINGESINDSNITQNFTLDKIRFPNSIIENTIFASELKVDNLILFKIDEITYWYPGKIIAIDEDNNNKIVSCIIKPYNKRFLQLAVPRNNIRLVKLATVATPGASGGNLPKKPRTRANRKHRTRTRKSKSRT